MNDTNTVPFNRGQLQASNWQRGMPRSHAQLLSRRNREAATYPTVPSNWPNRATRRAVKTGREHRLSQGWAQVLVPVPSLRAHIRGL